MKILFFIVAALAAVLAVNWMSGELSALVEVRRIEASARLAEAQAARDLAAAQRIQAETVQILAEAQKAQAVTIITLAVMLAGWSAVIAAGGVIVALVALKRRASAALPVASWPVSYEIVEGKHYERR